MKTLVTMIIFSFLYFGLSGCQVKGEANIYYPEQKLGDPWKSRAAGFSTFQPIRKENR